MNVAFALTALLIAAPAPKGGAPAERRVTLDAGVTVAVPAGFDEDETELAEGGRLLKLHTVDSALLVTVYTGRRAPSHGAALDVHTEELARRVGDTRRPTEVKQRFVGRVRGARELAFDHGGVRYAARVVSARQGRRTLVAVWTWPDGGAAGETLARAVESVVAR